jgi:hypothetical protein
MNASQQEKVLAHLMEGKSITPLEALRITAASDS